MSMTMDDLDMARILPSNILSDVQSFCEDRYVPADDANVLVDVVTHLYLEKFLSSPNVLLEEMAHYENVFLDYAVPGYKEEYGVRIAAYVIRDALERLRKQEMDSETLSDQIIKKELPGIVAGYGRYLAFVHSLNVSLGEYPHDQIGIPHPKHDEWHTWPDYFIENSQNVSWEGLIAAWKNSEIFSSHQKWFGDTFDPLCFLVSLETMCNPEVVRDLFDDDSLLKGGLFGRSKKKNQTFPYTDDNLVEKYLLYFETRDWERFSDV